MSDVKVKICGIRTYEAAVAAIDAGADFLGFNFAPTSKRFIAPLDALSIIQKIRSRSESVRIVGVFENQSVEEVNTIVQSLRLDFVQLHGQEKGEYLQKIVCPIIKRVLPSDEKVALYQLPVRHFLLDREIQGLGNRIDMQTAKNFTKSLSLFLAGGLTPENVSETVVLVRPFAVDVASGIETNGKEDIRKIRLFIQNAKGVVI